MPKTPSTQKPPYTVAATQRALNIGLATVYRWLDEGRLQQSAVVGNTKLITAESVERVKDELAAEKKAKP